MALFQQYVNRYILFKQIGWNCDETVYYRIENKVPMGLSLVWHIKFNSEIKVPHSRKCCTSEVMITNTMIFPKWLLKFVIYEVRKQVISFIRNYLSLGEIIRESWAISLKSAQCQETRNASIWFPITTFIYFYIWPKDSFCTHVRQQSIHLFVTFIKNKITTLQRSNTSNVCAKRPIFAENIKWTDHWGIGLWLYVMYSTDLYWLNKPT